MIEPGATIGLRRQKAAGSRHQDTFTVPATIPSHTHLTIVNPGSQATTCNIANIAPFHIQHRRTYALLITELASQGTTKHDAPNVLLVLTSPSPDRSAIMAITPV